MSRITTGTVSNKKQLKMALEKGQKAPDFTLKSKNAEGLDDVKLSNNYGNKKLIYLGDWLSK